MGNDVESFAAASRVLRHAAVSSVQPLGFMCDERGGEGGSETTDRGGQ
jgi:hypothetical protein